MAVARSEAQVHAASTAFERDPRTGLRHAGIVTDLLAVALATLCSLYAREAITPLLGLLEGSVSPQWPAVVPFAAVLAAFFASGLYERDAFVSRPLHLWSIIRASAIAFILSAAAAFLARTDSLALPRVTLLLTFGVFVPLDASLRLVLLDGMYMRWVRRRRPVAFVAGDSPEARRLAARLRMLRGFSAVRSIMRTGRPVLRWGETVGRDLDALPPASLPGDAVFVDSTSLTSREVLDVIRAAQSRGTDAYVASGLLGPLDGSSLLKSLFQTPVTRVRRAHAPAPAYALKRALDILGSLSALIVLSPVIATIAAAIRLTSPGPVFHSQTRVGRSGKTFPFLKFRSMYVDCDSKCHEDYVHALINGKAAPTATDADGNGVFKISEDPRITPVGHFIRKFSLDEIPQLFNVLRGDMSLVGARPPLPYEVSEYDDWQKQRLDVQPGITGVWQVVGRNRVSFDEMIFQDLMYGMNACLLVDLRLCLRTIPAALVGSGL
jgi:exopolysaccharide biosynthesis polyprenyl glycosylphosphotransferase